MDTDVKQLAFLWRVGGGSKPGWNGFPKPLASFFELERCSSSEGVGSMLMYSEIRKQIDELLVGPLFEAFKAVDCATPQYDVSPLPPDEAFRAKVRIGHLAGTPEARYLVQGLGSQLELYVQLNVYRLVVVYRIPAQGTWDSGALQPRFARWAIGATDAGWSIGWRDAIEADDPKGRAIEVYGYASLPIDFLKNEHHQLYWITDVVQMTRSFLIEARRAGVNLPLPIEDAPIVKKRDG